MSKFSGDVAVHGTTTHGPSSPGVVMGDVTYALDDNRQTVPVRYSDPRPSHAGARSAGSWATTWTALSAVAAWWAIVLPAPIWDIDQFPRSADGAIDPLGLSVRLSAVLIVLAAGLAASAMAWGVFVRRRRREPTIGRRLSPFRSLIPRSPESSEYVRTTPHALCSECRRDGREEWARIRPGRRDRGPAAFTRCRHGHVIGFRQNSLFAGDV